MTIFIQKKKKEIIINESDTGNVFKSIYTAIIANVHKSLGKGSRWIYSVIDHSINISKCNPLAGSRYIKLELDHPRKGLIKKDWI